MKKKIICCAIFAFNKKHIFSENLKVVILLYKPKRLSSFSSGFFILIIWVFPLEIVIFSSFKLWNILSAIATFEEILLLNCGNVTIIPYLYELKLNSFSEGSSKYKFSNLSKLFSEISSSVWEINTFWHSPKIPYKLRFHFFLNQ